ncbi:MAG: DUF481 domain-containing protein [Aeromonadaceae bacterium]
MLLRLCFSLLCLFVSGAQADLLVMRNGDRLTGHIQSMDKQKLHFLSPYAGVLVLDWSQVSKLTSDKPLLLELDVTPSAQGQSGASLVEISYGSTKRYLHQERIKEINPPERFSEALEWKGNLDVSLNLKRQETATNDIRLKTDNELTKGYWRDSIKGSLDHSRQDGEVNTYEYDLTNDLDYFWSSHWFWRGEGKFQHDFIADLYQEWHYGSGPGYRFYEDKQGRFELGSLLGRRAYKYHSQPDMDFGVLGLSWDYRRMFDRSRLELFTNGDYGYPFFDQVDHSLSAEAGARYSLSRSMRLTLSTELDVLEGELNAHQDWKHFLGLGYSW